MLTEDQRQERNRAGVRKWYGENREDYNALRRERYAADEGQRVKARERAARYRKDNVEITRKLFRELKGKSVEVFSTGQVAEYLDRTPQMIRNWERASMIPPSSFPDAHRLYTQKQMDMIRSLEHVILENGGSWANPAVKARVRAIHKRW
jgi:hypothetical protein